MKKSSTQLRDDWLNDVARNKHVCINHSVRLAKCLEENSHTAKLWSLSGPIPTPFDRENKKSATTLTSEPSRPADGSGGGMALTHACAQYTAALDACVADWRQTEERANVVVRGDFPGQPPPQCQRLACGIQDCLKQNKYDDSKCKEHVWHFKHCTKLFYGSEYVD